MDFYIELKQKKLKSRWWEMIGTQSEPKILLNLKLFLFLKKKKVNEYLVFIILNFWPRCF